jgi:hypothetical protein
MFEGFGCWKSEGCMNVSGWVVKRVVLLIELIALFKGASTSYPFKQSDWTVEFWMILTLTRVARQQDSPALFAFPCQFRFVWSADWWMRWGARS